MVDRLVRAVPDPETGGRGLAERPEDEPISSEGRPHMDGMTWIRILLGAIWLNGAAEKILNPQFPRQFAQSLEAGGVGELVLGLGLLLGLLTNLAALGSMAFSLLLLLSQGGVGLGTGLGPPEFLTLNLVVALLSLVVLLAPGAKSLSLDGFFARLRPGLAPLLLLGRRPPPEFVCTTTNTPRARRTPPRRATSQRALSEETGTSSEDGGGDGDELGR